MLYACRSKLDGIPHSKDGEPATRAKQVDDPQHDISEHFDSTASYWDSIYGDETLQGAIYLRRQAAVLDEVDAAGLSPGARVLTAARLRENELEGAADGRLRAVHPSLGRPLMSKARALRTNTRLQRLADRRVALIRWTGWHYLAQARKPA